MRRYWGGQGQTGRARAAYIGQRPAHPTLKGAARPSLAAYAGLAAYQNIHQIVLKQAEGLSEEQIRWRLESYSTSIGFHVWHLAREADSDRQRAVERSGVNVLVFMLHDARHLGMIECLTGLQTGCDSATEQRP